MPRARCIELFLSLSPGSARPDCPKMCFVIVKCTAVLFRWTAETSRDFPTLHSVESRPHGRQWAYHTYASHAWDQTKPTLCLADRVTMASFVGNELTFDLGCVSPPREPIDDM